LSCRCQTLNLRPPWAGRVRHPTAWRKVSCWSNGVGPSSCACLRQDGSDTLAMTPPQRLAGRLALVTGATRGVGRAVALAYAREGAHLILVGRTAGALEEGDDEIRAGDGTATLLTLDLKAHDKIDALGPTIYQRWGKLDVLVGNAGI